MEQSEVSKGLFKINESTKIIPTPFYNAFTHQPHPIDSIVNLQDDEKQSLCCMRYFIQGQIISQPQSTTYQFKDYIIPFGKQRNLTLRKTICGFLNNSGGIIFIGIHEDQSTKQHTVKGAFINEYIKEQLLKSMRINFCSIQPDIVYNSKATVKFVPVKQNLYPFDYLPGRYVIRIKIDIGMSDQVYSYRTDEGEYFVGMRTENQVLSISCRQDPRKILSIQKERARMAYLQSLYCTNKTSQYNEFLNPSQSQQIKSLFNKHQCTQPNSGFRVFERGQKIHNFRNQKINKQHKDEDENKDTEKNQSVENSKFCIPILNDIEIQKLKQKEVKKSPSKYKSQQNKAKGINQKRKLQIISQQELESQIFQNSNYKQRKYSDKKKKIQKNNNSVKKDKRNIKNKNKIQSVGSKLSKEKDKKKEQKEINEKNTDARSSNDISIKSINKKRCQFFIFLKSINSSNHQIYLIDNINANKFSTIILEQQNPERNHIFCSFDSDLMLYKFDDLCTEEQMQQIFSSIKQNCSEKINQSNEDLLQNKKQILKKLTTCIKVLNFSKLSESKQEITRNVILEIQNNGNKKKKEIQFLNIGNSTFSNSEHATLNSAIQINTLISNAKAFGSLEIKMANLARAFLVFIILRKEGIKSHFV